MQISTKVLFSLLFFALLGIKIGSSLTSNDIFSSMDDARGALLSFYQPNVVKKAKDRVTMGIAEALKLGRWLQTTVGSKGKPGPTGNKGRPGLTPANKDRLGLTLGNKSRLGLTLGNMGRLGLTLGNKSLFGLTLGNKRGPVKPQKRVLNNKFVEALEDIEKALAEAQQVVGRVTHNAQRLKKLQGLIKTAVQKRSYRFARKLIGEAIYTIAKMKEKRFGNGRGKRQTVLTTTNFLGNLKQSIGDAAFNELLAMQGQVTLMFAIDKTGSMQEEIDIAKKIAQSIVDQNRSHPVEYILSPFSDPASTCGPVTYCEEGKRDSFVTALKDLNVTGGWDCPELAFKGIIDAIDVGQPQDGSPMYVMTDAGPKDASEENMAIVQQNALENGYVINFFVFDEDCSRRDKAVKAYKKVAQGTSGQVFRLKTEVELKQLTGLTAVSLGGSAVISNAAKKMSFRKRRAVSRQTKSYSIPIDDSIDTLVISVTTDESRKSAKNWGVSLTSPSGILTGVSQKHLDKATVYQITNPSVGVWNLGISNGNSVNYDYYAKATSVNNIDFEYYFVKRSRRGAFIPITNPVQGQQAHAILTLGGMDKINENSLQAELMTLDGELLKTSQSVSLKSEGKGGIRQMFTFTPPGQLFKIKLKGKTKKGNTFERISHSVIKSESLLVKILFAKNDFTVPQGASTFLLFLIENFGNNEVIDVRVFGSLGTIQSVSRNSVLVRKRRKSSFTVRFSAKATAEKGITITIVVLVKGKSSGSKSTLSVPLLVV